MYSENSLVEAFCFLKLAGILVQPTEVVGGCHGNPVVIGFILNGFLLAAIQSLLVEHLACVYVRECVCTCMCVCVRERENVNVCVCVREIERENVYV